MAREVPVVEVVGREEVAGIDDGGEDMADRGGPCLLVPAVGQIMQSRVEKVMGINNLERKCNLWIILYMIAKWDTPPPMRRNK